LRIFSIYIFKPKLKRRAAPVLSNAVYKKLYWGPLRLLLNLMSRLGVS